MYFHPLHINAFAAIAALSATRSEVAVAACIGELAPGAPSEILLIPAGEFRARDGRPERLRAWKMTAEDAQRMIAASEAANGDYVIDYEHQTLLAEDNGQPAPAAGWFKRLEWRDGAGLYAVDVRWTARATALIDSGEYRYISPVFEFDKKSGNVTAILMAALTNYPALDGHSDLAARAAARFQSHHSEEDNTVDRDELIKRLGLNKAASDAQINEALAALKAKADSVEQKDAEIASLKAGSGNPDPAKFVPVETFEALKTEVATLKADKNTSDVEALVQSAIEGGKLLPVQEDWARELGAKDMAALKGYLEKTPAIAALNGSQSGGKGPGDDNGTALTTEELAVCKNLGITAEEFQATKATKE